MLGCEFVTRVLAIRRLEPDQDESPHPEERPDGPRLEGWERVSRPRPSFETAAARPPRDEGVGANPGGVRARPSRPASARSRRSRSSSCGRSSRRRTA
jgi:hypothetical protein